MEDYKVNKLRFLDLFSGIGGFRLGMEQAGHECVGYVEWDKFARKSYESIYETEGEWTANDIRNVTNEDLEHLRRRGVDCICGGFPCQSFSVAGKRGGFEDTRGTMFFEIARFAKKIKPRLLLLENVKGLLSHSGGQTFGTILNTLDELGYDCEWQMLNSKDFGVPQNRERVFIIGHLRGASRREVFPIEGTNGEVSTPIKIIAHRKGYRRNTQVFSPSGITETLDTGQGGGRGHYTVQPVLTPDRINKRQNGRRFKNDGEPMFTLTSQDRHGVMVAGNVNPSGSGMNGQVYKVEGLSPTLTTNKGEGPKVIQKPRGKNKGGVHKVAPTVTSNGYQDNNFVKEKPDWIPGPEDINNTLRTGGKGSLTQKHNYDHVHDGYRIRKLTPRECWRLQGFPDWVFDKASEVNSDSQLYKQAGNSVTVNVIYEIAKRLS